MSGHQGLSMLRQRVMGVAMVAVIVAFVAFSVAMYQKAFTPIVPVTLDADHVGNQLVEHSDVKINGVVVGEVRQVRSVGDHAELSLALQPNMVHEIPANVSAQLLPKTLFGQRYVNLVPAPSSSGRPIKAGDVIPEDRTSTAIEVDKALTDLQPVLQAVQPQKLSETLTAVSTALDGGRGKKLGETMVMLNNYLKQLNPSLPSLDKDIQELGTVSDDYNRAAPQLLQALNDMTTTSRTLVQQQQNLAMTFADMTSVSTNLTRFLNVNKDNLIQLQADTRPTAELLAKYAPEYPCVFDGLRDQIPNVDRAFGKGSDHPHEIRVHVELTNSRGKYEPGKDTPAYEEHRGPQCYPSTGLGNRVSQYPPGGPYQDGSGSPPAATTLHRAGLGLSGNTAPPPIGTAPQSATADQSSVPIMANSPEEQQLVSALVAPDLQVPPSDVPNWAGLLVGPLYRGAEVTVQ